jgi:spore maturation protein CgeB
MEKDYSSFPPIGIISYSDFYDLPERRVWGDYWLKEHLTKEFQRLGYPVDHTNPKVVLHLFGEPVDTMTSDTYSIIWIHSHPDWVTPEILSKYRKIFCISRHFIQRISDMGFHAEHLMIPTHMTPLHSGKIYDIVFVGNTKKNRIRPVISDLGNHPYNITIWGWGWKGLIPDQWYGGDYYENEKLNELYSLSKIVLNDHHEDMRREGFINPRIIDVLASGSFVISDDVLGMDELLNSSVATYSKPEELRTTLDHFLQSEHAREEHIRRGQNAVKSFTYSYCCLKIVRHIELISDTLSL